MTATNKCYNFVGFRQEISRTNLDNSDYHYSVTTSILVYLTFLLQIILDTPTEIKSFSAIFSFEHFFIITRQ